MADATAELPGISGNPDGERLPRRFFTAEGETSQDVFDKVEWEIRDALIGALPKPSFHQPGVEFPKSWSQNATNIVSQKYFRGQLDTPARENSVRQMISRVAETITGWGVKEGYFQKVGPGSDRSCWGSDAETFCAELTYILVNQMAAFNSPVWFNVGFEESPQCSACFILSVEDEMDSILAWNTKEGKIFRGGSGSGINLSKIRAANEPLTKGGTASGPVSFMRGADSWAGTIKSGGKTRRAAKMVVLDVDHPDIQEFIWCKAKEEDKAAALRDAGFDMSIDGEGFISIQYQNANNSVRVTEEFMRAVEADGEWTLTARRTGEPMDEPVSARGILRDIAEATWRCADPGVQYDTIINEWHTCPNSGRINASNPCSEYMHVDDSACNLASINLMKFRKEDGTFDVDAFEHTVDIVFLAQEIVVGPSSYPTDEIGKNARAFRQIGLGYTNLGAYLMANGTPYDSNKGRGTAAAITALMTGRSYAMSARIAAKIGPYEKYPENREPHNAVMRKHRDAVPKALKEWGGSDDEGLDYAARNVWDLAVALGDEHGYRNAQATVLAPTGTISFLMDCDTTGIEPDFSLVKHKELVGGGNMVIVNQTVRIALETLGYNEDQVEAIVAFVRENGTIIGSPGFDQEKHGEVFDVAVGERAISWTGHVDMMAAVQPFISGAISKTVNMPQDSTVEDIMEAYIHAWKTGVKALAIYRDGSKTAQALRTDAQKDEGSKPNGQPTFSQAEVDKLVESAKANAGPVRRRMPVTRDSVTHKFSIAGHEGYITAGVYEDGTLGEIFLTDIGKEGSTLRGMMNSFATIISMSLQYGVPLETLVQKFTYMKFEPNGITRNPEIPFANSLPDYIMKWLASRFLGVEVHKELGLRTPEVLALEEAQQASEAQSANINPQQEVLPVDEAAIAVASNGGSSGNPAAIAPIDPLKPVASILGDDLSKICDQCGGIMQRTGSCYTCYSCGNNTGCG